MKIKSAYVKNITVFEDLEIEFSSGINVIIGKNGMGKTHLLKLLYMHNSLENIERNFNTWGSPIEDLFGADDTNLKRKWLEESLVVIHTPKNFEDKSNIKETLAALNEIRDLKEKYFGEYSYYRIYIEEKKVNPVPTDFFSLPHEFFSTINDCIFIPSKEILSNSKGFLALNHQKRLSFDKTYADIISNAELPEARNLSEISQKLLETISNIIGGTVTHEDRSFYIKKGGTSKTIFSLEAEGFKKFALLWKLIQNGLFEEDTKLFWDEPEANINPELMPALADILLALQKNGVQIFIATHDFFLPKYLDVRKEDDTPILFHSFYHDGQKSVQCESQSEFGMLEKNPIISESIKLYKEEVARLMK